MEDMLQELRDLKRRVTLLESRKVLCYETILSDMSYVSIDSVLHSNHELYIQMCDYVFKYNVFQLIDKNKIYICHKGAWIKGNPQELKELFIFIEKKWIGMYLDFVKDDISGEEFEKYNDIIYSLNLTKNITKIKDYIIELLHS